MGDDEEEYVELSIKKVPKSFRVSQVVQVVDVDEDEYPDEDEDDYYEDDDYDQQPEEEPFSVPPPSPFGGGGSNRAPPPRQPPPSHQPQPQPHLPQPKPSFPPQQQSPGTISKPLPQPGGGGVGPNSSLPKAPLRPTQPAPSPGGSPVAGVGAGGSPGVAAPQRPLPKGPPVKPLPLAPQVPGRPLPGAPASGGRKLPTPAPKAPSPGYSSLSQSQGAPQSNVAAMQEKMSGLSFSSPSLPISPKLPPPPAAAVREEPPPEQLDDGEAGDRSSFVVMNSTQSNFTGGKRFSTTDQQPVTRRPTASKLPEMKKYGSEVKEGVVEDPTKARTTVSVNNPVEDVLKREEADEHVLAKGWLLKKGRRVKNWKKRWFVLKGPKLYYYKKANDESSKKGIVHLESCIIEDLKPRPDSRRPCMALLVQGRKLLIVGERDDENRYWYLVLVCKNAELTYKRKRRLQNLPEDLAVIDFLRNPLVRKLALDEEELPLEAVVALSVPIRCHTELQMVSLRYAKLGSLELEVICDAIAQNKSIEVLHLEGNGIDVSGAKCLAKLVTNSSTIRELYLDDNKLGDEGVKLIASAVPYSQTRQLQVLTFHKNNIGTSGVAALCQMYASTELFTTLPLSENPIGDEGIGIIANMINQNRSLSVLELENCSIGERGFTVLANALNRNNTIKEIKLKGNDLDDNARKQMAQTLMVNKTLTMIDLGTYKLDADQLSGMRLLYDCGFLQGGNVPAGANVPPILKQFQ